MLAMQLQEREFRMYKALGGQKTMENFLRDLEQPYDARHETHAEARSFWDTLSDGTKAFFKDLFAPSTYTSRPVDSPAGRSNRTAPPANVSPLSLTRSQKGSVMCL